MTFNKLAPQVKFQEYKVSFKILVLLLWVEIELSLIRMGEKFSIQAGIHTDYLTNTELSFYYITCISIVYG